MNSDHHANKHTSIRRIGGYLHRVVPIADASGKVLSYALKPLMVEFRPRDVFQVVVGSTILAIPVAFTEEAWTLAEKLPWPNTLGIMVLSLGFVAAFVLSNFYNHGIRGHVMDFFKRTLGTYLIAASVVAIILSLIQRCPWGVDNLLALKRIIIVSFPAYMTATISDTIK